MHRKLKYIRQNQGFSLKKLSSLSGVGASTIGNWENGKTEMSFDSLKMVCAALGVTPEAASEIISYACNDTDSASLEIRDPEAVYAVKPRTIEDRLESMERLLAEVLNRLPKARP
jgi:transcriptional regulator with XRE-family HTH domain